jgi:ABC-type lipoprotein release transport system permease subunit
VAPILALPGSASHGGGPGRAGGVTVLGVDGRFASLFPDGPGRLDPGLLYGEDDSPLRRVVLNAALARELGAEVGDPVLLWFGAAGDVPRASLLGERDAEDRVAAMRLTVAAVLPDRGGARFSLAPGQAAPKNAFVPLARLQRELAMDRAAGGEAGGRVNALLAAGAEVTADPAAAGAQAALERTLDLGDYGLTVRGGDVVESGGEGEGGGEGPWLSVESRELVLRPAHAEAALAAADALGAPAMPVLSYLANTMRFGDREVPYSAVAALPMPPPAGTGGLTLAGGSPAPSPAPALAEDEVLLDAWTAEDLGAAAGDELEMDYFVVGPGDELETASHRFRVAGVVALEGLAIDPGLTPEVPGIAGAEDMSAWDPPFPVDLDRIRPRDEEYWDRWRAAPKAFVTLAAGQRLWASRFGDVTSVRVAAGGGGDRETLERELLSRLEAAGLGLAFEPVKARGLEGAAGSTGFPGLFLGFSIFLIAAAALLVALLFALGLELRAREIGLLLAIGYPLRRVRRRLLGEAAAMAALGALAGLALAAGYARALLALLGRWWAPLVEGDVLGLALEPATLAAGFAASLALTLAVVYLTLRRLAKVPARALLAGVVAPEEDAERDRSPGRAGRWLFAGSLAAAAALAAAALLAEGGGSSPAIFFGLGAALLTAGCAAFALWTRRAGAGAGLEAAGLGGAGAVLARLAARNSARHRGRSLLAAVLVACAAFVLVAVAANRRPGAPATGRESGTGGFALVAESAAPLLEDLDDPDGRYALGFGGGDAEALAAARFYRFRLRPGDDASCLNLYRPGEPRLLGVPAELIARGGFSFAGTIEERDNPWSLLDLDLGPGVVPAIGDAESVRWILRLGLGDELAVTDERGEEVRLRFVALLDHSLFQSELLIPEAAFRRHFPSRDGFRFFLAEAPAEALPALTDALESRLAPFGFDARPAADRLAGYDAVRAMYLTTFQALGGLGLLLGTLGLGVVLARNVLERRGELAAMRAFGWRRSTLAWMVAAENAFLLAVGLGIGAASGLAAVAPHLTAGGAGLPWVSLGVTLAAVAVTGMLASAVAVAGALRVPLLPALRAE